MSTKFSGQSYKPGIRATRNSREIWQIYFDDEDLHGDLSGDLGDSERMSLQGSSWAAAAADGTELDGGGARSIDALDRKSRRMKSDEVDEIELINNATTDDRRRSKRKSNRQAYHQSLRRPIETEIRAIPTGSNGNTCTFSTMTVGTDTSSTGLKPDASTPIRSGQSLIHIRRDSDLELLLPQRSDRCGSLRKKAKECCSDCSRWPTWRKVLCVAVVVIVAILLYVVIMVAIVKGIGG